MLGKATGASRRCSSLAHVAAWACNVAAIVIIFVVIFLDTPGNHSMRIPMISYSLSDYVDRVQQVFESEIERWDLEGTVVHVVPRALTINYLSYCAEQLDGHACTRHDVFDDHPVYEAIHSDVQNVTERLLIGSEHQSISVRPVYHITLDPSAVGQTGSVSDAIAIASLVKKQEVTGSHEIADETRAMEIVGSDTVSRWSRSQEINSGVPFILLCLGLSITIIAIIIEIAAFVVFHMKPHCYRTPINVALVILIFIAAAVLTASAAFITAQINGHAATYTPYDDYDPEQFEIDEIENEYGWTRGLEGATITATPGMQFRILTWIPVGLSWASFLLTVLATYGGRDVTGQARRALRRNISSPRAIFQSSSQRNSVYGWQRDSNQKPDARDSEPPSGVVSVEKGLGPKAPRREGEGSRQARGEDNEHGGHVSQRDSGLRSEQQEDGDPMRRVRHSDVSSLSSGASSLHDGAGNERRLSAL